jgi:hypothetical protein
MAFMKLLKQDGSGEIYVWTLEMAKRSDMKEYVRPPVNVVPPEVIKNEQEVTPIETEVVIAPDSDESDIATMAAAVLKRKGKK